MGLKGEWNWIESMRLGGRKALSFTLRCDNLLRSETFDCAIVDGSGQRPPQVRRALELKPRQLFRFDYDTCDWDWHAGDYFALLDKRDQPKQRWLCNPQTYRPGECPQCHGTMRCPTCGGTGTITERTTHRISYCASCHGTGRCQTCFVPTHDEGAPGMPNPSASRGRQIAQWRQRVEELQRKIEHEEFELRMMQIRGTDVSSSAVYFAKLELKAQYERSLINAQYQLQQLEQMQS